MIFLMEKILLSFFANFTHSSNSFSQSMSKLLRKGKSFVWALLRSFQHSVARSNTGREDGLVRQTLLNSKLNVQMTCLLRHMVVCFVERRCNLMMMRTVRESHWHFKFTNSHIHRFTNYLTDRRKT